MGRHRAREQQKTPARPAAARPRPEAPPDSPAPQACATARPRPWLRNFCVAGAFVLGLLLVYGPMLRHELVHYDTESLILDNYHLRGAPTGDFLRWALTTNYGGYWMPLTWVTHRIDVQLHGYQPWAHLLTNFLIHFVNVFLLLLVLRRMTGSFWRSAAVVAIFAFHPMRAESVAWVAERKDILSSFFWMVTLLAYERYTRGAFAWWRYLPVVLGQALALLCKPSVVTLPFALLLLDYWPLRRWAGQSQISNLKSQISNSQSAVRIPRSAFRLLLEKAPLFCLIVTVSIMTYKSQRQLHIMAEIPLSLRLASAPVHYLAYLSKSFFPVSLSVLYPHARVYPNPLHLAAAALLLVTVSVAALRGRRRRPWFFVGWFWFLGVLLPMVGVVQVFLASIANRYTYLSQIGLAICVVWGGAELAGRFAVPRRAVAALAGAVLAVLMVLAIRQVATWQDDVTLWTHAIQSTARNDYAWNNLGNAYAMRGDREKTRECYRKAVELRPDGAMYRMNYGRVLEQAGDTTAALEHYQAAVAAKPEEPLTHIMAGEALLALGRADEALAQFDAALAQFDALARSPRNTQARAYADRGAAWALMGALDRAAADDRQALALDPSNAKAHYELGLLAAGRQDFKSAIESFSAAARLQPAAAEPLAQLGQVYAAAGDKAHAAESFRSAQELARRAGNAALEQKIANFLQRL